jgi:hypothetical protein
MKIRDLTPNKALHPTGKMRSVLPSAELSR